MKTQLHLTPADRGRRVTLEEFLSAGHEEGFRYELIEGKVEASPIPDLPHEELLDWLKDALKAYARARPDVINKVKGPARVFLPVEDDRVTAPEPDVAAYHNYPEGGSLADRDWRLVSPLLVVEILSADSGNKDLVRNRELYLEVPSVREYWMLDQRADPDRPTLLVLRRRGGRWGPTLTVGPGEAYATRLLPGFRLVVDPHHEA